MWFHGRCSPTGNLFGQHGNVFMTDTHFFQYRFVPIFCHGSCQLDSSAYESLVKTKFPETVYSHLHNGSEEVKYDEGLRGRKQVIITSLSQNHPQHRSIFSVNAMNLSCCGNLSIIFPPTLLFGNNVALNLDTFVLH